MNAAAATRKSPDGEESRLSSKERMLCSLLVFFIAALFIPGLTWLYNVGMWVLFVAGFYLATPAQKWTAIRSQRSLQWLLLFFLVNLVSALLSHNLEEGISWLGIRISLLVFPLAIGTLSIRPVVFYRMILYFSLVISAAALLALVVAAVKAGTRHDPSLLYNDNLTDLYTLQSVYFALLVNLAIIGYAWLWVNGLIRHKAMVLAAIVLLVFCQCLLASRVSLIFLVSAATCFVAWWAHSRKRLGILLIFFPVVAALVLAFTLIFPKSVNRFRELGFGHYDYQSQARESHFNGQLTAAQWNGANIRLAIWNSSSAVIKRHWLTGVGIGDKMDSLLAQYRVLGFDFGIKSRRNLHNSYLDVLFTMGVIGLTFFLVAFAWIPLRDAWLRADGWAFAVIACFLLAMFPETYLDRTVGNTFLSFFYSLLAARTAGYRVQNGTAA